MNTLIIQQRFRWVYVLVAIPILVFTTGTSLAFSPLSLLIKRIISDSLEEVQSIVSLGATFNTIGSLLSSLVYLPFLGQRWCVSLGLLFSFMGALLFFLCELIGDSLDHRTTSIVAHTGIALLGLGGQPSQTAFLELASLFPGHATLIQGVVAASFSASSMTPQLVLTIPRPLGWLSLSVIYIILLCVSIAIIPDRFSHVRIAYGLEFNEETLSQRDRVKSVLNSFFSVLRRPIIYCIVVLNGFAGFLGPTLYGQCFNSKYQSAAHAGDPSLRVATIVFSIITACTFVFLPVCHYIGDRKSVELLAVLSIFICAGWWCLALMPAKPCALLISIIFYTASKKFNFSAFYQWMASTFGYDKLPGVVSLWSITLLLFSTFNQWFSTSIFGGRFWFVKALGYDYDPSRAIGFSGFISGALCSGIGYLWVIVAILWNYQSKTKPEKNRYRPLGSQ